MKRAFVLPGCAQDAYDYHKLNSMLESKDYLLRPVHINWKTGSFKSYIAQAKEQIIDPNENDLTIGFSYGGNIALYLENNPSRVIACSTPDILDSNKRKVFDRLTLSSNVSINWEEVGDLHFPTNKNLPVFVAGSQEKMYAQFAKYLAWVYNSEHKIILGAGHDIDSPVYLAGLEEFL